MRPGRENAKVPDESGPTALPSRPTERCVKAPSAARTSRAKLSRRASASASGVTVLTASAAKPMEVKGASAAASVMSTKVRREAGASSWGILRKDQSRVGTRIWRFPMPLGLLTIPASSIASRRFAARL